MGFYNIKIIMKYLYKSLNALFFILCLVIIFFLIFINLHSVSATTFTYEGVDGSAFSQNDVNDITNSFNNVKGTSQYFILSCKLGERAKMCIFDNYEPPKFYVDLVGNSRIISSTIFSYRLYWLNGGGSTSFIGSYNTTISSEMPFSYVSNLPMVYGNLPIYNDSSFTSGFWCPDNYVDFVAPSFVNYDDSNWDGTLVNGEFNYFYIEANDSSRVLVYVYDETFQVSDEPGYGWSAILDNTSPYVLHDSNGNMYWAWSKNEMFGSYQNEHTYQLSFQYLDENGIYQDSQVYRWTTDFSQAVLNGEYDEVLGDINKGLNDINGFLNNSNYDQSSIVNSMPSTNVQDPTENQINNIFTMIRSAFSTTNAQNVVIALPHTDETITIPPDLVTSHIPTAILILIQGFYWYIICRFIIKDISKTVEHAKSGEILDAKDGNIKTDLL